ncbi:MAG: M23 family metallopeptidase [Hyphomicrobiales bacterium]
MFSRKRKSRNKDSLFDDELFDDELFDIEASSLDFSDVDFSSLDFPEDEPARPAKSRHVIDIAELDTDHHNPFHNDQAHKSRWLVTTCVAGMAGGLVIGGALLGTLGLDRIGGLTRAGTDWQQTESNSKGDRIYGTFGVSSFVSRRDVSNVIAEQPYKRITVAFDRAETTGTPNRRTSLITAPALVGSLAPDYTPGAQANATPFRLAARPNVLDTSPDPDNSTIITKSFVKADSLPYEETIVLGEGQTLMTVLMNKGTMKSRAVKLIRALEPIYPTKNMSDGQQIKLTVQLSKNIQGHDIIEPIRLSFAPKNGREIIVEMDENGQYLSRAIGDTTGRVRTAGRQPHRSKASIRKSLYVAAKEQGVPEPVIIEMMRVHGYDVDFQRQIRPGDSFEVFYGAPDTRAASSTRDVVLFSALTVSGQTKGYFRFTTPDDGITDYYDETGKSATKFLMRTPINGARISSRYGMRRHPILGYTKMHSGIDFAAPYGTPIKAAGDGVIKKIGRVGAYGKYIRIRHANGYETAYAHMSRFSKGLVAGSRVRQNQVIGYVGSTGRSTGAHLHYEVLVKGKQVDPMKLRMPTGRQLDGDILNAFNKEKGRVRTLMAGAPVQTQVARAENQ